MSKLHSRYWIVLRCTLFSLFCAVILIPVTAKSPSTRITIWTINQPGLDVTGDWMEREIRRFETANPGIIVEHRFWENQSYKVKLKVAMFSGEGPDILFNWGGESQQIFSREGLLYDLTNDLGKDKWGLSSGMFATHSFQGRIYGVPIFPSVEVIWYNKDIFKKYGWKTPQTWDEFLTLCARIKSKEYIPVAMGGQEPWTVLYPYMYFVDRLGGNELYLAAKARQIKFTQPEFVESFRLLQDMMNRGYLPTEVLSLSYVEATQLLLQNKALMMFMGDWEYLRLTNQMRKDFDKWDFFPFPALPGGKGSAKNIIGAVAGYSIKKSEKSKIAVKFLKFLSSQESLTECYKMTGKLVTLSTPYMREKDRPQIKGIAKLLVNTSSLTQWWDQDLPGTVSQSLLQSLQDLLAGKCSPEQAAMMIEASWNRH